MAVSASGGITFDASAADTIIGLTLSDFSGVSARRSMPDGNSGVPGFRFGDFAVSCGLCTAQESGSRSTFWCNRSSLDRIATPDVVASGEAQLAGEPDTTNAASGTKVFNASALQCRIGLHVDIVYFTADFPTPSQKFQW